MEKEFLWPTWSKVKYQAVSITKRNVRAKKPYSEGEILGKALCATLGTGTEIVNALNELIGEGYVYRSEEGLKPTEKGLALHAIVKGLCRLIEDKEMAGPYIHSLKPFHYGCDNINL